MGVAYRSVRWQVLSTLAALPGEIDSLRRQGYRFVKVTQLLGLRLIYR
ncbi:MAG: hypothetical protein ACR2OB_04145 [Solirubrobacteraceae bacterium]